MVPYLAYISSQKHPPLRHFRLRHLGRRLSIPLNFPPHHELGLKAAPSFLHMVPIVTLVGNLANGPEVGGKWAKDLVWQRLLVNLGQE